MIDKKKCLAFVTDYSYYVMCLLTISFGMLLLSTYNPHKSLYKTAVKM